MNDEKTPAQGEPSGRAVIAAPADRYIHSDVFQRLVENPGDIPGLVAYGIYQTRKREWIDTYKKERGRSPSEEEVKNYSFGWRDGSLEALRGEAEADMFRFAEAIMQNKIHQMIGDAFNERTVQEIGDLKGLVRSCSGYRHHIVGHVAGFGVLVVIAAFIGFVFAHEPSLREAVGWIFQSK